MFRFWGHKGEYIEIVERNWKLNKDFSQSAGEDGGLEQTKFHS